MQEAFGKIGIKLKAIPAGGVHHLMTAPLPNPLPVGERESALAQRKGTIETFPTKYEGRTLTDKLKLVRVEMQEQGIEAALIADATLLSWLLGLRSHVIHTTPVILGRALITQKDVFLEELRECCGELVQDCYGNYVIQFVMQHGCEHDQQILMKNVMTNLVEYSQHKFASNVVEKCLQFATRKDRDDMIWKIINATLDTTNPENKGLCVFETMVRDPYANYVVQKVIEVSDERQRTAIMRYVKENINQLRKYTYGKHIIISLEKVTNEKF
jgi:ribosomal protein S7